MDGVVGGCWVEKMGCEERAESQDRSCCIGSGDGMEGEIEVTDMVGQRHGSPNEPCGGGRIQERGESCERSSAWRALRKK